MATYRHTAALMPAARSRRLAVVALLSLTAGAGCTRIDNALASVPVFAHMRSAPSFDPYEHPLPAPPGSIPFESPSGPVLPPLAATEQALREFAAGPWGRNPLAADDEAALALGQSMYERHCSVCHGQQGRGDGPIIGQGRFPLAPTLVAAPATELPDGYVYGVIRAGRGLMPAYGARMTHVERWAVVTYVNRMQADAGATAVPTAPEATPGAAPADTGAMPPATTDAPATDTAPVPADTTPSAR